MDDIIYQVIYVMMAASGLHRPPSSHESHRLWLNRPKHRYHGARQRFLSPGCISRADDFRESSVFGNGGSSRCSSSCQRIAMTIGTTAGRLG
ncbi:hypothetical protein OJAV_G00183940 [Oryzias javanicus]|uniref:Uncharacterized protein n=1 Tax=Oryzias javanicus TaxID=123683 RepID=A0A3S2PGV2_ORYJA|nr:hypothetical protein OJAV_G00183940 [Oryzias javanicus]